MGDFLAVWLRCKIETKAIENDLSAILVSAMEEREEILYSTPTILCAIYLDPRWHIMLNKDHQTLAEKYLGNLWDRMQSLKHKLGDDMNATDNTAFLTAEAKSSPEKDYQTENIDPLERMLREKEHAVASASKTSEVRQINNLIKDFKKSSRMPVSEDILQYWEKKRYTDSELYQLSQIVLAVPATQVSVERIFSHLAFILNRLRNKMGAATINNILLIRCNHIFDLE